MIHNQILFLIFKYFQNDYYLYNFFIILRKLIFKKNLIILKPKTPKDRNKPFQHTENLLLNNKILFLHPEKMQNMILANHN